MLGKIPKARYAHYGSFFDQEGDEIDKGVALFFPAPNSFTEIVVVLCINKIML
jgi:tRNA modification GTPase